MHTIQEIEAAVSQLPKEDFISFREWFEEFDAQVWDKQIEENIKSGKLDKLAEEALADFNAGRCKEL